MQTAKKILIVEDELIISYVLEKMVISLGYEVVGRVSSGEEAIEKALATKPDIILMDIRLDGEIDGIEAMVKIQQEVDVPAIYITGNTDQKYKLRVKETNYLDFLIKPVTQYQLSYSLDLAS